MHRTDAAGNDDNRFTNGNPSQGIPATVVDAKWLNAIQEEIVSVILAAGITLDDEDTAQLLAAINALVPAASATKRGKVELATSAETQTMTDEVRAVTPAGLAGVLQASGRAAVLTGSGTFTAPINGNYLYMLRGGGGGGGGGGYNSAFDRIGGGGQGGGGGAEVLGVMALAAGEDVAYIVGPGGEGGSAATGVSGAAGGQTTFGAVTAAGGVPGNAGLDGDDIPGSVPTIRLPGTSGGGAGGAGGVDTGPGSGSGNPNVVNGQDATQAGGGGGGGAGGETAGGHGADGQIVVILA